MTGIPNDGGPRSVTFTPRKVKWMRFEATDGAGRSRFMTDRMFIL
ncbi:hypothetical protein [Alistipes provencensis]